MFKKGQLKKGLSPVGALILIILLSAVFAGGYYIGREGSFKEAVNLAGKEEGMPTDVDFSAYWKAWVLLDQKFVPSTIGTSTDATTTSIKAQDKVWRSIEGLARAYGDPYTVFLPPRENEIFETSIKGNFEGVGMEIGIRDDLLTVIAPLKNSPAERAGFKPGDKILQIGDTPTTEMSVEEAVTLIRGPKDTVVKLTIFREENPPAGGEPRVISVTRDIINIPTLDTKTLGEGTKKVFVISLYSFSENSIALFRDALVEFTNSGNDKLIIDLRGNPGGYLEAAVEMASFFLPEGKVVVREYFGPGKEERIHRSKGFILLSKVPKVAVLVNGGSASASEILAGALSEHGVAKLIGEKTFGKGSVQELLEVTPDTALKVTVARWLTPNGQSISHDGLLPDAKVELTREEFEAGKDPQLDKAVSSLLAN